MGDSISNAWEEGYRRGEQDALDDELLNPSELLFLFYNMTRTGKLKPFQKEQFLKGYRTGESEAF